MSASTVSVSFRYEVKDDGKGNLSLHIHKLTLDDEAEYTCKIGRRETTCKLTVDEGEAVFENWIIFCRNSKAKWFVVETFVSTWLCSPIQ